MAESPKEKADDPLARAMALDQAGRLDEAIRIYEKLLSRHPDNAGLRHLAGSAALKQGDSTHAADHLQRAVQLRPSFHQAHNNLGQALAGLNRVEEALASYRQAIALVPEYVLAIENLASTLLHLGRYEDAFTNFDRVIELDPDNFQAHYKLGIAFNLLGRHEDALTSYRRATSLDPADPNAVTGVGSVLEERGKIDEAIACYRKAQDLDPTHDPSGIRLRRALGFRPDLDSEIAACRENLAAQPDDCEIKVTLAGLLWRKSEVGEAGAILDAVLAEDETNAAGPYHLGLVHRTNDDTTRSRSSFERALALCPGDVNATAALASLDAVEPAQRAAATKRVALYFNQPFHYSILKPVFDALKPRHCCLITPHVTELTAFEPDVVVLAEANAPFLRGQLPTAIFVMARHGLISKNASTYTARVSDYYCLTSEATRDWYIQNGGQPRRDFWITGYPQMDQLFRPGDAPLEFELAPDAKVVLYAPTYTPGLSSADMLGGQAADLICGRRGDICLLIKPHPITATTCPEWIETWRALAGSDDRVHLIDDPAADVMPLLKRADILVTDASSVMFAYLAMDRPIVLITNPARQTSSHYDPRGIEWRWRDVGREIHHVEDLAGAVDEALDDPDLGAEARARYRRELFGEHTDGRASERIAQHITDLEL